MALTDKIPAGIAMMLKGMGIDPGEILNSVDGFRQIMAAIQSELITIRRQNAAIMKALGVSDVSGVAKDATEKPGELSNEGNGGISGGIKPPH